MTTKKGTPNQAKKNIGTDKSLPLPLEGAERTLYLMRAFWRPILSIIYTVIVLCDFVLFPLGFSILQTYLVLSGVGIDFVQWQPMTLADSGLFHVVMGSFIGITSFTRSLEKRMGVVDNDIVPVLYDEEPSTNKDVHDSSEGTTNTTSSKDNNDDHQ